MRNSISLFFMGMLLLASCSDSAVITELEKPVIETRNAQCTLELEDEDIVDDCEVFDNIYMDCSQIHIELNTSLFSDFSECMDAAWIYDPSNVIIKKYPLCGERDSYDLYCSESENHGIIVDLGNIESGTYELELCIVSECIEFLDLLDDCSNETGSGQTYGTFCFEMTITCT